MFFSSVDLQMVSPLYLYICIFIGNLEMVSPVCFRHSLSADIWHTDESNRRREAGPRLETPNHILGTADWTGRTTKT